MDEMMCLRIVDCKPLTNNPRACKDLPKELWMPLNKPPSYISRLIDGEEVAHLIVKPCT